MYGGHQIAQRVGRRDEAARQLDAGHCRHSDALAIEQLAHLLVKLHDARPLHRDSHSCRPLLGHPQRALISCTPHLSRLRVDARRCQRQPHDAFQRGPAVWRPHVSLCCAQTDGAWTACAKHICSLLMRGFSRQMTSRDGCGGAGAMVPIIQNHLCCAHDADTCASMACDFLR